MKNNKKGFTLIELLAVIVILAIIMVIAVPQILNVINDSRSSAWKNSVKMIENAIETNATLFDPSTGAQKFSLTTLCTSPLDTTNGLPAIVDLGDIDTTTADKKISCGTPTATGKPTFTLYGKNQFDGHSAKLECSASGNQISCKIIQLDGQNQS